MAIGSSLADQATYVSVLYWGREGCGKTTAALRMVNLIKNKKKGRVVLINAEAGAKKKALQQHGIDPSLVEIWPTDEQGPGHITAETLELEVVGPMREALAADPDSYAGVVWDSATEIARRLLEDVQKEGLAKAQRLGKNRGRWDIELQDHGIAASQVRSLLRQFRDMPIHLAITALERRDVDQNTGTVSYGPAMGPAVATDMMGLVDLVAWCQVEEIADEEWRTATFTPTTTRRAKDRYGVLPPALLDPFFDRVVAYVEGDMTRDNDPVRARMMEASAKQRGEAPKVPPPSEQVVPGGPAGQTIQDADATPAHNQQDTDDETAVGDENEADADALAGSEA